MYFFKSVSAAAAALIFVVGSATALAAQSTGPRYPCPDFKNDTCQNFTDTYDDLPVNSTIEKYGVWYYLGFTVRSPGKATPAFQPHSNPFYARAEPYNAYFENEAYYLFTSSNYLIDNSPSFYFACAQQDTQKAVPCTLTVTTPESAVNARQQFKYTPKVTANKKIPLQFAQLDKSFTGAYYKLEDLKLSALDAKGNLTALIIDDLKYIALFPPPGE